MADWNYMGNMRNRLFSGLQTDEIVQLLCFLGGAIAFWSLRVYYWSITFEVPFSDMAGFDAVAHQILKNLDFSWGRFWQSFNMPTLPVLRAVQIVLFGESLRAWQYFQASFLFLSLCWAAHEVATTTKRPWLGLALLWTVALSKSSIFWSLKISREGIAEAFIYLCLAVTLLSLRKGKWPYFLLTGCIYAACFLNRSNFIIIIPLFLCIYFVAPSFAKGPDHERAPLQRRLTLTGAFLLGVLLLWSPWMVRSYRLYHHVVPISTQGASAFFWELGLIHATYKGSPVRIHSQYFFEDAPKVFTNDYEANQFLQGEAKKWLLENWRLYVRMSLGRVVRSITDRTEYLTKVSRTQLFPNVVNDLLLDKFPALVVLGMAGLFLLARYTPTSTLIIPIIAVTPWLLAVLVIGYPRMLEPMLPTILFGNLIWIIPARQVFGNIPPQYWSKLLPRAMSLKLFLGAILVGLLAILLFVNSGKKELGIDQGIAFGDSGEIEGSRIVGQSFVTDRPINGIDLQFASFGRENNKDVIIQIKDDLNAETALLTRTINAREIRNNEWTSLTFPAVRSPRSTNYFLTVESPDSVPGNAVGVKIASGDPYKDGELLAQERPGRNFKVLEIDQSDAEAQAIEVTSGHPVIQSFESRGDIAEIDIMFGTTSGKNIKEVHVHLKDDPASAKDLFSAKLDGLRIAANSWHRLSFPPVASSKGKTYYIMIESTGSVPGNGLRVRSSRNKAYLGGTLIMHNKPQDFDMAFKVYTVKSLPDNNQQLNRYDMAFRVYTR